MDISNSAAVPPVAVYTATSPSTAATPKSASPTGSAPANLPHSTQQALNEVNQEINQSNTSTDLTFSVDREINMTVVRVVDSNTKEVIAQFPAEVVVRIAHALSNHKGVLLQETA